MIDMIGDLPSYLEELLSRIVSTEKEQITRIAPLDSVPYFVYTQATFPYITHRLGDDQTVDQGDILQERAYTVIARFVVDHVTASANGQNEQLIYRYEPLIVSLFTQNMYLVSDAFPDAMPAMSAMPIEFKRSTGTKFFDNRGIGQNMPGQIGFEWSITAKFSFDLRRRY